jgi:hypothetical protein
MTTIVSRRVARAGVDAAAALFLDWSKDRWWRPRVRWMNVDQPGPARVGQRIEEELRFAGMTFVTPTRIEWAGPTPAGYTGGSAVVTVSGSREVRAEQHGHVTLVATIEVAMRGAMRPLTPVLTPMYRRLQERDLNRLAALLEALPG